MFSEAYSERYQIFHVKILRELKNTFLMKLTFRTPSSKLFRNFNVDLKEEYVNEDSVYIDGQIWLKRDFFNVYFSEQVISLLQFFSLLSLGCLIKYKLKVISCEILYLEPAFPMWWIPKLSLNVCTIRSNALNHFSNY